MKKNILIAVAAVVVLAGVIAGYFYWQHSQPKPAPVQVKPVTPPPPPPPPVPAPAPVVPQVVEAPPAPPPALPALAESDKFMLDALSGLVNNKWLMKWFNSERVIHNIVATIDNLPRRRAPMSVMPIRPARGKFITEGNEDNLTVSPRNAARYRYYMRIADAIDAKQLVALYVRIYPLFQNAYEQLGYPKKYFNDRLVFVIDNLLAAPNIKEPVKLVQPNVFYLYADPDLEGRSIGQRIMMRIGSRNEAKLKKKLREIKQELLLHMHDRKVDQPASAVAPASAAK